MKLQRPFPAIVYSITAMVCCPESTKTYERLAVATQQIEWYQSMEGVCVTGLQYAPENVELLRLKALASEQLEGTRG